MRVTLKEVASKAGVSYQTVSKVINGQAQVSRETEQRIWDIVKALGYRPNYTARSLRSKRSFTIGYSWVPNPLKVINPILNRFLESMLQAAVGYGYYLLSFPCEDTGDITALYREMIYTGRVDGFVLSTVEYDDPRVSLLQENDFPFVAFGRSNPEMAFPYVDVDGGQGVCKATEHLIEQGHQRISVLAWPNKTRVGDNRLEGYMQAMHDAGFEVLPEWVYRSEGTVELGYQWTQELLDLPEKTRPTGIVCLSDTSAIGAMQAIRGRGLRVGKDIGVTGFDNSPMDEYLPTPLTSVRQPVEEVGQRVIERLMEGLKEERHPDSGPELIPPELIIRESSLRGN